MEHTPGPWTWENHYADNGGEYHNLENENGDIVIDGEYGCSVDRANARLIAAAPEMLEALEELIGALSGISMTAPTTEARAAFIKAKEAAAKAKGQ